MSCVEGMVENVVPDTFMPMVLRVVPPAAVIAFVSLYSIELWVYIRTWFETQSGAP